MSSSTKPPTSTRLLRSNTLKTPSAISAPSPASPSNISLFLTNLHLLNLDRRQDWPDITAVTFSTKDSQQNQKKRIQCVEWALYQLFALWDPEETRNKLQPFFPPLEHLQSLNLRTALFRCLDHAKKNGALGRDAVLRKTMLDECKGERLEEVLAVFSFAVLKKELLATGEADGPATAQQWALEHFSYSGERSALSTLILAHRASLQRHLQRKEQANARYHDFADLLNLNDRRITRRHEQLKQATEDGGPQDDISGREIKELQDQVQRNWSGRDEWLESILYGDSRVRREGVLAARFDKLWKHVEDGSIGDIEEKRQVGLLEMLDGRVRSQEARLARWKDFGQTLTKPRTNISPSKKIDPAVPEGKGIDLRFNLHGGLQIDRSSPSETVEAPNHSSHEEYIRLIENMKVQLANVSKVSPRDSLATESFRSFLLEAGSPITTSPISDDSPPDENDEASSAVDVEEYQTEIKAYAMEPVSGHTPDKILAEPVKSHASRKHNDPITLSHRPKVNLPLEYESPEGVQKPSRESRSPPPAHNRPRTPSPPALPILEPGRPADHEADLADQILNSISTASPSPKKARHTLSLAERTRLSMSRASHSQYSDLHEDVDDLADLPRLSTRSRMNAPPTSDEGKHTDLVERTRKSMAGFEAAQKKAQIERRRSAKDVKRRARESSYFPPVAEEGTGSRNVDAAELIEGDPDYESVFKSRPRIKTSPAVSPTKPDSWEDASPSARIERMRRGD